MNILMMTNTYKPILGGLEKSVEAFAKGYRRDGHRVIIVVPQHDKAKAEKDVIRIPAIQNFNGSDFSVQLPIPGALTEALGDFKPDIVHSHHPFLMGDTALRVAYKFNAPLIFTHHTLYEQNTHYVPGDSDALKRFVVELSVGYCNLADEVFAPSESVMDLLKQRGVQSPIHVVPTGIYPEHFKSADPKIILRQEKIPARAFVAGYLGRLAPEKNLEFLARALAAFLKKTPDAHFLVVGQGPSEEIIKSLFQRFGLTDRLHLTGPLKGKDLVNAYHAMNVFVFASQSETQGLVLTEAMASGTPVVAVDAPGVREVVRDKINGRLLPSENVADFVSALQWMKRQDPQKIRKMKKECFETAEQFSMEKSMDRAFKIYSARAANKKFSRKPSEDSLWSKTLRFIQGHWKLTKNLTKATTEAVLNTSR